MLLAVLIEPPRMSKSVASAIVASVVKVLLAVCACLGATGLGAQELTPRAYWPAPVGTELVIASYHYQGGDVITDASLPVEGAESYSHTIALGYQRTINLLGRTANVQVVLPFTTGSTRAEVDGLAARRDVVGQGDISATLAVNLFGAPSFSVEEFQAFRRNPSALIAADIKVVAPTGHYDEDRLINIGNNRWATRLKLGYIQPLHNSWILEASAGTWFYGENDQFLGGTRKQDSVSAVNMSLIHRIRPGFWVSLDGTHYIDGQTEVDGVPNLDYQRNSRVGVTLAYPYSSRHLLKFNFSTDVRTEVGGSYNSATVTYAFRL